MSEDQLQPLRGTRILVMDDEAIIALDLQSILEDAGAVVVGPATTLAAALNLLQSEAVDCALLDLRMGSEPGRPAAERMHALGRPWIFHTGNADIDEIRRTWPACPVLIKPATPRKIVEALAALMNR